MSHETHFGEGETRDIGNEVTETLPAYYDQVAKLAESLGFDSTDAHLEREFEGHCSAGPCRLRTHPTDAGRMFYSLHLTVDPKEYPGLKEVKWTIDRAEGGGPNFTGIGYSTSEIKAQEAKENYNQILQEITVEEIISSFH